MSVLDKKLLLSDLQAKLDSYVPAELAKKILTDAGEILASYEVTSLPPEGGGPGIDESLQLLRLYLDAKSMEGKSPKTVERYGYILERLLKDTGTPFRKMTVYHLRQYTMSERDRGISMTTLKGNHLVYSGFFTWLHAEGLADTNPTINLGSIKAKPDETKPFTSREIHLIKEAAETDVERAIVYFLISTGCRISELCSVNRGDIDYRNLQLSVNGKGDKIRTVYIDDVTAMMIKRYLATRTDFEQALFVGRRGNRFKPDGIRKMLKRLEERCGISDIHPHRFRHTMATSLIDRGMSIQEVSAILGHSKLDTTMTYVHVNQRNTENNYRRYATV